VTDPAGPAARPTGRALPSTSAFAGDDGAADPDLARALAAMTGGTGTVPDVVAALAGRRVLVPVLAELEAAEVTATGLQVDKEASAGIVALRVPDGRTALPVFSSIASLGRWRHDARPVPTQVERAAVSALQEGWELLVLDPGGPSTVVVPHPAVRALAAGTRWLPAVQAGVVRADVREAVVACVTGVEHVLGVRAEPGRAAEVAVVLGLRQGLGRSRLDRVLAQVNARLAADDVVTTQVDSLELRAVPAGHLD
jgi:hypothetical protein